MLPSPGWQDRRAGAQSSIAVRLHPGTLLRFVQSVDSASRITDIVVDNWILKFVRAGRLSTSRHRPGYYTFG